MTMIDAVGVILPCLAGVLIGALFFGGLCWTVSKALSSKHPALWFIGSQLLRMSVALTGFYLVAGGRLERLLACLAGFIAARVIVTRLAPSPPANRSRFAPESSNAS